MGSVGIFYGSNTGKAEKVAKLIQAQLPKSQVQLHNIRVSAPMHFNRYENIILVASTWGGGDLQDDWVEFDQFMDRIDFSNKTVAFVGLGDQETYPDSFSDGIGLLYDLIAHRSSKVIGQTSTEGYDFHQSKAVKENQFIGLILDEDNQANLTKPRIEKWVKELGL